MFDGKLGRGLGAGLAAVAVATLAACGPAPHGGGSGGASRAAPPPTLAKAASRTSGALYTVEAKAAGAGVWTYRVGVIANPGVPTGFDSLRFRTSADMRGCKLALVSSSPASRMVVSNPGATGLKADFEPAGMHPAKAWTAAVFGLSCEGLNAGTLSLVLADVGGELHERVVVGPVIGPHR